MPVLGLIYLIFLRYADFRLNEAQKLFDIEFQELSERRHSSLNAKKLLKLEKSSLNAKKLLKLEKFLKILLKHIICHISTLTLSETP